MVPREKLMFDSEGPPNPHVHADTPQKHKNADWLPGPEDPFLQMRSQESAIDPASSRGRPRSKSPRTALLHRGGGKSGSPLAKGGQGA
jgi:hypothetical protein